MARIASPTNPVSRVGSKSRNRFTAAASLTGFESTGPESGTSSGIPMASATINMSEKTMIASTPSTRYGWMDTSAASSGVLQISRNVWSARTAWYSGRYLPAWRMIHTGTRSVGSNRQARRNSSFVFSAPWAILTGDSPSIIADAHTAPPRTRRRSDWRYNPARDFDTSYARSHGLSQPRVLRRELPLLCAAALCPESLAGALCHVAPGRRHRVALFCLVGTLHGDSYRALRRPLRLHVALCVAFGRHLPRPGTV